MPGFSSKCTVWLDCYQPSRFVLPADSFRTVRVQLSMDIVQLTHTHNFTVVKFSMFTLYRCSSFEMSFHEMIARIFKLNCAWFKANVKRWCTSWFCLLSSWHYRLLIVPIYWNIKSHLTLNWNGFCLRVTKKSSKTPFALIRSAFSILYWGQLNWRLIKTVWKNQLIQTVFDECELTINSNGNILKQCFKMLFSFKFDKRQYRHKRVCPVFAKRTHWPPPKPSLSLSFARKRRIFRILSPFCVCDELK